MRTPCVPEALFRASCLLFKHLQVLYESSSDEEEEAGDDEGAGKVSGPKPSAAGGLVDLEDIGGMIDKMKSAKQRRLEEEEAMRSGKAEPREMVTPMLRKALSKQGGCGLRRLPSQPIVFILGYRIVGSHSGVKLCRWTKSMLRGRGGCYKHTFYGIESHRCMETTPSLACANKCVFCWRYGFCTVVDHSPFILLAWL